MSDVEIAQTGAEAAPAENTATPPEQTQEVTQESATATPDEPKDDQPRDANGRFQKRVNELTRQRYEAQREAQRVQAEMAELRQQVARLTQPPPPDPSQDFPAYVRHLASEEARSLVEAQQGQWQQQQEQQRFQTIAQQYATREAEYVASHPDYPEAVEAFVSVVGENPQLAEVLMTSDHGPAVAHYLGSHLDEAAQIAALPPHLAAAAVARIEARVSAPKPKPVTKAPSPVPTVSGGAAPQPKDIYRIENDADWYAARLAQQR